MHAFSHAPQPMARPARRSRPRSARLARRLATVAALGAATVTGLAATPASAHGTPVPCTTRSESTVFSRWSDASNYFLMPNGGFESGTTDWKLAGGASVVTGNESWKVRHSADSYSLRIPYGATAESRTICVSKGEDAIRLFVKNPGVSGSILHVEVVVRNPDNGAVAQTAFDVNGDAAPLGWAPTMRLGIAQQWSSTGNQELTFVFSTRGSAATWQIDDVYVDPFRST